MKYKNSPYRTTRLAFDLDGIQFIATRLRDEVVMYTNVKITKEQHTRALALVQAALAEMDKAMQKSLEVTDRNKKEIARTHRNKQKRKKP